MGRWRWAIVATAVGFAALMWLVAVGGGGAAPTEPQALSRPLGSSGRVTGVATTQEREASAQPEGLALLSPDTTAAGSVGDADPTWPPGFESLRVTGRLLDAEGVALEGAEVQLIPDESTRNHLAGHTEARTRVDTQRAYSDVEGRFVLTGPWRRGTGFRTPYEDAWPVARVRAEGLVTTDFACAGFAGGEHDLGDLVVSQRAAGLRMRVVDPSGAPIAGVTVSRASASGSEALERAGFHWDAPGQLDTRSGVDGWVEQHDLWPLRMQAFVTHPAHPRRTLDWMQLVAGETLDLGDVVLDRGARVRGVVRDGAGTPIVGARVVCGPESWLGDPSSSPGPLDLAFSATLDRRTTRPGAESDDAGRFEFDVGLVGDRPVALLVEAEGYGPSLVGPLVPSEAPVDVALEPEARLRVAAYSSSNGAPVEVSRLMAFRRTGTWIRDALRSDPLPVEGDTVRHAGALSTLLVVEAFGYTQLMHEEPGVAPGAMRDVVVSLEPAQRLSVWVRDAHGDPVRDVTVHVSPLGGTDAVLRSTSPLMSRETITGVDGLALFLGLSGREWRLDVTAAGRLRAWDRVLVPPEVDVEHTVVLESTAALRGVVLDAQGAPAVAAPLVLWGERHGYEQLTDVNGRFEFPTIATGEWRLQAELVPDTELVLRADEELELELVQGAPAVLVVDVRLNDAPLADQVVFLNGPEGGDVPGHIYESVRTDAAGRARFELKWPGEYFVNAQHAGAGLREASVEASLQQTERVSLEFTAGTGVLGGVLRATGFGTAPHSQWVRLDRNGGIHAQLRASPGERFQFENLPAGSYTLQVRGPFVVSNSLGPIELQAGQVVMDADLDVVAYANLSGTVFHSTGEPFDGWIHLRAQDGSGDYRVVLLNAGRISHGSVAPGTWQLDLATFSQRELGPDGRGEPGAELPFFAREVVTLAPGETRELNLVIPGAPP